MFGKLPRLDEDFAFAAGVSSAANGFDFNADTARGIEEIGAFCNLSSATRWHENDLVSCMGGFRHWRDYRIAREYCQISFVFAGLFSFET